MEIQNFLQWRESELREFFTWRFQTSAWTGPLTFCTGLPRYLGQLLHSKRRLKFEALQRVEHAALHLGFLPGLPRWSRSYLKRMPPLQLPVLTAREVKERFYLWRRVVDGTKRKLERERERKARLRQERRETHLSKQKNRGAKDDNLNNSELLSPTAPVVPQWFRPPDPLDSISYLSGLDGPEPSPIAAAPHPQAPPTPEGTLPGEDFSLSGSPAV